MTRYFNAVAIDYDGTLTYGGPPPPENLDGLLTIRRSGRRLVLVTGRILDELREVFPGVDDWFDAIVAENGAVMASGGGPARALAPPVPDELDGVLGRARIPHRRGRVLLEIPAVHSAATMSLINQLELDCQILRNRGAAMILPIGVSKATGLAAALEQLGLSAHNCVGIGDAENDHALLDACEIGVAAPGALLSLRAHADVTLDEGEMPGLLRAIANSDFAGIHSPRWRLELGRDAGVAVTIPASRINLLITGPPGSGKSYLTGLLCEQLVRLGYSTLVLDLEGDHVGLASLGKVITVGGEHRPPDPGELPELIGHHTDSTLVVNLANRPDDVRRRYSREALAAIQQLRDRRGIPQWVVIEEAHVPLGIGDGETAIDFDQKGVCQVSYLSDEITRRTCDAVLTLGPNDAAELSWRGGEPRLFVPANRDTSHVRHLHKYESRPLPVHRQFYFRDEAGLTGRASGSLLRFCEDLDASSLDVLRHHARGREFSRWIRDVLLDLRLAHQIRNLEASIDSAGSDREVAAFKADAVAAIARHCGTAEPSRLSAP